MAGDTPDDHGRPAVSAAEATTRASLVSLGSSIAEDISGDFGDGNSAVPNEPTLDGSFADSVYHAPESLDVTRASNDSAPPAFDSGYFDDAGTATPLFASPRVHHDPPVPSADGAFHGRRAGVPRPPPPVTAGASNEFGAVPPAKPPPSPTAVSPASARASALASSYAVMKQRNGTGGTGAGESSGKKFADKTPHGAVTAPRRGGPVFVPPGGSPEDTTSALPPTPMFLTPAPVVALKDTERPKKTDARSRSGSPDFDSDEELSPSSAASVPLPSRRDSTRVASSSRNDPNRSSANPPLPRATLPTPETKDKSSVSDGDGGDETTDRTSVSGETPVLQDGDVANDSTPGPDDAIEETYEPIGVPWHLERIALFDSKQTFVLDPETRQVFTLPPPTAADGRFPAFVGRVSGNGQFTCHKPLCDFFETLKRFCQTRHVSVAELFRLYDDGAQLSFPRFTKLCAECLLPSCSSAELAYLFVMLDLQGNGVVTPENVAACVREMATTKSSGKSDGNVCTPDCVARSTSPSLVTVLQAVAKLAAEEYASTDGSCSAVACLFKSLTPKTSWTGTEGLDARGILRLVDTVFPGIIRADSRVTLAEFKALDLTNDGLVSLQELRRGLRLAVTQRVVPGEGFGKPIDATRSGDFETKPASARAKKTTSSKKEKTKPKPNKREGKENHTKFNKGVPLPPKPPAPNVAPSPLRKREELAIRKQLRATRVRLDKKVALGLLFEKDVRAEIGIVEEKLRAAAYEKKLVARRAAMAVAASERELDATTKAFRKQQLQKFDEARRQQETEREAEGDASAWYRSERDRFGGYNERGVSVSQELFTKWREEEAYAMVETYGNEAVLAALEALRRDGDGGFRADSPNKDITRRLGASLTYEEEERALDLIAQAKLQTRLKKEAAAEAAEEAAEQQAHAAWVQQTAAKQAWDAEEADRRYDDEYDADLALEGLRHDRLSSDWTRGVGVTPPSGTVSRRYDDRSPPPEPAATSVFPSLFAGYPASPSTIGRSPRRFTVDGEARFAIAPDLSKEMYLPRKTPQQ